MGICMYVSMYNVCMYVCIYVSMYNVYALEKLDEFI